MELIVNQPTKQVFTSASLVTGKTTFTTVVLLDGNVTTLAPPATYTEIGGGVYTMNFTPSATGRLKIFIEGQVQIDAEIVTKTLAGTLKELSDEALGSWSWNKTTGVLTLYKSDASVMSTYNIVDTVSIASRERIT